MNHGLKDFVRSCNGADVYASISKTINLEVNIHNFPSAFRFMLTIY